ncbi:MAG: DUF6477 family protein [Pseudomonadota bacterium]
MQDVLSMLQQVRRPALLMRAARIGAADYRRDAHLPRLLGFGVLPRHGAALMKLMQQEEEVNQKRLHNDRSYSLVKHVDLLIAMIGEARVLQAVQTH